MNKVVNIYPKTPVLTVNPPIRCAVRRVTKPLNDIRECIIARAVVEEVMSNGTTIRLNLNNYDKNNNISTIEKTIAKAETQKSEEKDTNSEVEEKTEVVNSQPINNNDIRYGKHNKHNKNRRNNFQQTKQILESKDTHSTESKIDQEPAAEAIVSAEVATSEPVVTVDVESVM